MSLYVILSIVFVGVVIADGPAVLPQGKLTGSERMNDPKYEKCLSGCPVTMEFGPQCASDGKSYPNPSSVGCFAKCLKPLGEDLKIVSTGFCPNDVSS